LFWHQQQQNRGDGNFHMWATLNFCGFFRCGRPRFLCHALNFFAPPCPELNRTKRIRAGGENNLSCPADCCPEPKCGDGFCDAFAGEDCASCPKDCKGRCVTSGCIAFVESFRGLSYLLVYHATYTCVAH
jgi:hypothetical protein